MPVKARAAVQWEMGAPWTVEEIDVADPGTDDVLVRMHYAGLCHSDDHNITGDLPAPTPLVGGHEGAGEVIAVGDGVTRVAVGDRVLLTATPSCGVCRFCTDGRGYICDANADVMTGHRLDGTYQYSKDGRGIGAYAQLGTFSEYTLVRQARVVPIEGDIPLEVAAVVSCGVITGYGSATNATEVRPGQTVVVVGVGGVGMSAMQGARIAGAARIVAIDPVAMKRDKALEWGATHAVASVDEAEELLRELTRGAMADAVILTVGVLDGKLIGRGADLAAKGGKIAITAVSRYDDNAIQVPISAFSLSGKSFVGVVFGQRKGPHDIHSILDLYRAGALELDGMISRSYKLDEIAVGYEDMHAGKNIRGVIQF